MRLTCSGEAPSAKNTYSGRIVETISEEMSVSMLVTPSRTTVRGTCRLRVRLSAPRRNRMRALSTWYTRSRIQRRRGAVEAEAFRPHVAQARRHRAPDQADLDGHHGRHEGQEEDGAEQAGEGGLHRAV